MNTLWHGDNLLVLRQLSAESVDLVYLDPPFKSDQTYNMLYKERDGSRAAAQVQAFSDTWQWDRGAVAMMRRLLERGDRLADVIEGLRRILGSSDMMAYLVMMAPRLVELHRVLKPTGSLYLHCDPTASHYLKLLLDAIFGADRFRNEIVWKRTTSHSDARQGAKHFGRVHDVLLFYVRSERAVWCPQFLPHDDRYVASHYPYVAKESGRRYGLWDITGPGGAAKGNPIYDVLGVTKYWRYSQARMQDKIAAGRVIQPRPGAVPREVRYLDESQGAPVSSVWTGIQPINSQAKERLGYPTQKPQALLERIIRASTVEGATVLDPFCGCGTTVEVAQLLNRRWIGIDITHLAIDVIKRERLDKLKLVEKRDYKIDRRFAPRALPDIETLAVAQPHTFQGWALEQAGIETFQLKPGPDRGIDARKPFFDPPGSDVRREIIVSVKGGKLPPNVIRDLIGTVQRERAQIGVLITLREPTAAMVRDALDAPPYKAHDGRTYTGIQILTVKKLIEGHIIEYPLQAVPMPIQLPAPARPRIPKQAALLTEDRLTLHPPRPKPLKAQLKPPRPARLRKHK